MEISNALPVQFWLVGCDTYNEHEAAGVHHKCYCAPWQCDDNIKVQLTDDGEQTYTLEIYNASEQLLGTLAFEEVVSGVYEVNLNLAQDSPDVCEEQIQLKIKREAGIAAVTLPALDTFVNDGGPGTPWTLGATPSVTRALIGSVEILHADFAFIAGVTYTVNLDFSATGSATVQLFLQIQDSSFVTQFSASDTFNGAETDTIVLTFTATVSTTRIAITAAWASNDAETITITGRSATRTVGTAELVAKSDCLDIRTEHEDSILLTYSNHRNFAGLVYEDISPANEFQIRIPSTFFHQRFPEEDEVMELSTSLVTLNGTVRKQRLLDTDYVPYYFHEKMKLILKHQMLEIFDRQWVKQEAYEIVEGDRRWPMKKAKVWLSEKDFVHRNIL